MKRTSPSVLHTLFFVALFGCATYSAKAWAKPGKSAGQAAPSAKDNSASAQISPALQKYIEGLPAGFDAIPADRKRQLDKLALFIKTRRDSKETARVTYICTHNSRRSHMGQIFATLAAAHYGVDRVEVFSGGTEVKAFNPRAVAALERAGFAITNPGGENPHYKVTFASNRPAIEAFSKKYDDAFNPKENFAAVMTCSQADKSCPTVAGATLRIPLHYEDPKESDGTPTEAATYDARARQIATEAFYVFSRLKV
ncbi:MAG: protein-tyrosine-phosphatase [Polyangia bacterium]